jgi:hypothetical protein
MTIEWDFADLFDVKSGSDAKAVGRSPRTEADRSPSPPPVRRRVKAIVVTDEGTQDKSRDWTLATVPPHRHCPQF